MLMTPVGEKKINTAVLVAIHTGIWNQVHSSRRAYYSAMLWRAGAINIQLKEKHKT